METPETVRNAHKDTRTPNDVLERACADTDRVELELLAVVERLHHARGNAVHRDDPSRAVQKRLRATVGELDQALTRERVARKHVTGGRS